MIAKDILTHDYQVMSHLNTLNNSFKGVYATDLLSQAIKSATDQVVLITLISHDTTVALAMMIDCPVIIITEGKKVMQSMIDKCNEENICLIQTSFKTHEVIIDFVKRGLI